MVWDISLVTKAEMNIDTPFLTFAINATTEDEKMVESAHPTVYPCLPNFELNN